MDEIIKVALMTPTWILGESLEEYEGRWGLPLLLTGPPGVGKTRTVQKVAKESALLCHTFATDSLELDDLGGILVMKDGSLQRLSDNEEVQCIIAAQEGVLFVDELNANQGIAAAINRLVYEGEFCRKVLPPRVRILAAMNPPELSAGGSTLAASTSNRMCQVAVKGHSLDEWSSYLDGVPSRQEGLGDLEKVLHENWEGAKNKARMQVRATLSSNSGLLNSIPEDTSQPWPSERSWLMATNALATTYALDSVLQNPAQVAATLVAGCVGREASEKWLLCAESGELPSLDEVLEGSWSPVGKRLDVIYAVVCSLVNVVNGAKNLRQDLRITLAEKIYRFVGQAQMGGAKDVLFPLVAALSKNSMGISMAYTSQAGNDAQLSRVLEAANKVFHAYGSRVWR